MSSRATRVDAPITPFTWHVIQAPASAPAAPVAAAGPEDVEPRADEPPPAPEFLEPMVPEARLAEVERDAFARGFAQGERAANDGAAGQANAMLRRLSDAIGEVAATRQEMIRRTERQVVELAIAIARHMLKRELTADRGILLAMARVALDELGEHTEAAIRLNPADHALLSAGPAPPSTGDQVKLVADPALMRGQCLVECAAGIMDVSIDSQFQELARTLIGEPAGDAGAGKAR